MTTGATKKIPDVAVVRRRIDALVHNGRLELIDQPWAPDLACRGGSLGEIHGIEAHKKMAAVNAAGASTDIHLLSFDLNNPPGEPPPDCRDRDKWRWAYAAYREHESGRYGRCTRRVCDQRFPCAVHKIAQRALIDACVGTTRHSPLPGPGRIVATAGCRWCRRETELHSLYGWVHVAQAFLLCREPLPGCPPMCVAEPAETAQPTGTCTVLSPADQPSPATYTDTP